MHSLAMEIHMKMQMRLSHLLGKEIVQSSPERGSRSDPELHHWLDLALASVSPVPCADKGSLAVARVRRLASKSQGEGSATQLLV